MTDKSDRLLSDFERWLVEIRKLARSTMDLYARHVGSLLHWADSHGKNVEKLSTSDIEDFLETYRDRPPTRSKLHYPLVAFFDFLVSERGLTQNTAAAVRFPDKLPTASLAKGLVRERLRHLSVFHQQVAWFVAELREAGGAIGEIFEIRESVPASSAVRVKSRRKGVRLLEISDSARNTLDLWEGELPIGTRALQRAIEEVDLSPKDLTGFSRVECSSELARLLKATRAKLGEMDDPSSRRRNAGGGTVESESAKTYLRQFEVWIQKRNLGPRTVRQYVRHVTSLAEFAEANGKRLELLEAGDIQAFLDTYRGHKAGTQANLRPPLRHFFMFLVEKEERKDNPTEGVEFTKAPPPTRRQRRQIGQLVAQLSPTNRKIALFVSELLETGATVTEIFEINEKKPIPRNVQLTSGWRGTRKIPLSEHAHALLEEWGGFPSD